MSFNPDHRVEHLVALVIDETNPQFGQMCRVKSHDWRESGDIELEFSNGKKLTVNDGDNKVRFFYAFRNERGQCDDERSAGPLSLISAYLELGERKGKSYQDFLREYRALVGRDFE